MKRVFLILFIGFITLFNVFSQNNIGHSSVMRTSPDIRINSIIYNGNNVETTINFILRQFYGISTDNIEILAPDFSTPTERIEWIGRAENIYRELDGYVDNWTAQRLLGRDAFPTTRGQRDGGYFVVDTYISNNLIFFYFRGQEHFKRVVFVQDFLTSNIMFHETIARMPEKSYLKELLVNLPYNNVPIETRISNNIISFIFFGSNYSSPASDFLQFTKLNIYYNYSTFDQSDYYFTLNININEYERYYNNLLTGTGGPISHIRYNPNGRQFISCSWDINIIKLWDVDTGSLIRSFVGHNESVTSLGFNSDGSQLLSGSSDNTIKLWDTSTGNLVRTFTGHTGSINSVVFTNDNRQFISGSLDNTIKLWDISTGRVIRTYSGHSDGIKSVAISNNGRQIISGAGDKTIKLWDLSNGRLIRTFYGHDENVSSVIFSPDDTQIVSSSWDSTVKLWDVSSGNLIRTFSGHDGAVWLVRFSPNGRQILSSSTDTTAKLWDITTGNFIREFSDHISDVSAIFSPDGNIVLTWSLDTTIKLWETSTGRLIRTIGTAEELDLFSRWGLAWFLE